MGWYKAINQFHSFWGKLTIAKWRNMKQKWKQKLGFQLMFELLNLLNKLNLHKPKYMEDTVMFSTF